MIRNKSHFEPYMADKLDAFFCRSFMLESRPVDDAHPRTVVLSRYKIRSFFKRKKSKYHVIKSTDQVSTLYSKHYRKYVPTFGSSHGNGNPPTTTSNFMGLISISPLLQLVVPAPTHQESRPRPKFIEK